MSASPARSDFVVAHAVTPGLSRQRPFRRAESPCRLTLDEAAARTNRSRRGSLPPRFHDADRRRSAKPCWKENSRWPCTYGRPARRHSFPILEIAVAIASLRRLYVSRSCAHRDERKVVSPSARQVGTYDEGRPELRHRATASRCGHSGSRATCPHGSLAIPELQWT